MSDIRFNHTCKQFLRGLKNARMEKPCISAGELAKHMGVSRATAKKYLNALVHHGSVVEYDFIHTNGQTCTAYMPAKAGI